MASKDNNYNKNVSGNPGSSPRGVGNNPSGGGGSGMTKEQVLSHIGKGGDPSAFNYDDLIKAFGSWENAQNEMMQALRAQSWWMLPGKTGDTVRNKWMDFFNKGGEFSSEAGIEKGVEGLKMSDEERATLMDAFQRSIGSQSAENRNSLLDVLRGNKATGGSKLSALLGNALQANRAVAEGADAVNRQSIGMDQEAARAFLGDKLGNKEYARGMTLLTRQERMMRQANEAAQPGFWDYATPILAGAASFIPGVGPAASAGVGAFGGAMAKGGQSGVGMQVPNPGGVNTGSYNYDSVIPRYNQGGTRQFNNKLFS